MLQRLYEMENMVSERSSTTGSVGNSVKVGRMVGGIVELHCNPQRQCLHSPSVLFAFAQSELVVRKSTAKSTAKPPGHAR